MAINHNIEMNPVAETILEQLGGRQFMVMTGVKQLAYTDDSLTIKIGRNSKAVTHFVVTLDPSDTYTVQAMSVRGTAMPKIKNECNMVYCDQLQEIFETYTGLYTHL